MRNIKLSIQYDGTNYNGWQIQKRQVHGNIVTIQGILQDAITKITGMCINLKGASRTDAGVHAIEQVASFRTSSSLSCEVIKRALNANLPYDIRVIKASDAEEDFHPRYDAKSKIYFYVISNSDVISPFFYKYIWNVNHELDFSKMVNSLKFFQGTHDFSSFRASGCGAKNTVRNIIDIKIQKLQNIDFIAPLYGNFIIITIEANAFLRHMARNIVGTIVEVGKGRINGNDIEGIILSKDRKNAGPTAPAWGLFLEKIKYS